MRALNGRTMSGSSPPEARESALASLAHNWAPDACWSTVSPPPWSGCGSEFRSTLTSLMSKPSFAMLAMIIGAVRGIAAVEHDVALGPGDEEGRDVVRADVVEVAGDAERFGGLLPADLCRVQPPADEHQRKNAQQSQQGQPASLGGVRHKSSPAVGSLFNPCGANYSMIHKRDTLIGYEHCPERAV